MTPLWARAGRLAAALLITAAVAVGACGGEDEGVVGDRLKVVTTVSPITNIAANVGGGLVEIEGVIPEGENSHEFEPAPSLATTLAQADLVLVNGLSLENPTRELAQANLRDGAEIVELGSRTIGRGQYIFDFSFPRGGGDPNPHLWTDPRYAIRYAELIRDAFARRDPAHAADYRRNAVRYIDRLRALDAALRKATATLPRDRRKLLTYHDSFAYFARSYGWSVVGAIQPSDFSEPTAKDVARLIEQVRRERVPAIFGSEVFPSPVLRQIAAESGARYVDDLRDDDHPGRHGERRHSLVDLLRFDYATIVRALGGDPSAIERVRGGNPVGDDARYVQ